MHGFARSNLSKLLLTALMVLALCACAASGDEPQTAPAAEGNPAPVSPEAATAESMQDHALRDLSRRLNVLSRDIQVVSVDTVTWADGAMGCPLPGFSYTQALVPGFHVVLAHGESEYHYHGGQVGRPLLCPQDRRQPPLETSTSTRTQ